MARTPVHVALLRGVNVGGKHRLPMTDLAALFEELGAEDVRTLVQSGNVVFAAGARVARSLPDRASEAIAERFGHRVPVVLRTAAEMERVVSATPFPGADPSHLHVAFLREKPARARAASLEPDRSPGDAFVLAGRELHLHLPNGVARTKLTTAWMDARLGTVATLRNRRTCVRLAEMAAE